MSLFSRKYSDDSFGSSSSSWTTSSKTDSRFNMAGDCFGIWHGHEEMKKAIENKEKQLKVEAPDDLEVSVCKD